jgi:hypothetical protein
MLAQCNFGIQISRDRQQLSSETPIIMAHPYAFFDSQDPLLAKIASTASSQDALLIVRCNDSGPQWHDLRHPCFVGPAHLQHLILVHS